MTNPSKKYRDRPILTDEEIAAMIDKADMLRNEYYRLRVKALIGLLKKFGKRRIEIAMLKRLDLKPENGFLYVTFTIAKKHKRGLFQYLKYLRKVDPVSLTKPLPELEASWKVWQTTEEGQRIKTEERTKRVSLEDRYAKFIMEYVNYLKVHYDTAKFLFPSGVCYFGQAYIMNTEEHLSGRQLLRLIKPLNHKAWLHLFRETKGAEIAREEGNTISGVYTVRDTLDLEQEATAYRYIRRYAVQEVKAEA